MTQLIQNIMGLKPEHQNENPLFEKIYFPPDYGNEQVSRLYPDGSLYFLTNPGEFDESLEKEGKWGFVSTVNSSGMGKIKSLIKETIHLKSDEVKSENTKGIIVWKISVDSKINEIKTTIIPETKIKILNEINKLVNINLNPISAD